MKTISKTLIYDIGLNILFDNIKINMIESKNMINHVISMKITYSSNYNKISQFIPSSLQDPIQINGILIDKVGTLFVFNNCNIIYYNGIHKYKSCYIYSTN